ncbi:MAG: hypothetical protein HOP12_09730 [Candidatus Eisenbacteria bacterium]|uniref:Apea-like HEPN domain-containing protein n=1 Tax=Eiseniibacteriota bacterium TaxID=2212470 RepID=A0A849SIJ4_UNCEI|nr:hypothetical protein [Candidatus Eisenbacteria bacterium]
MVLAVDADASIPARLSLGNGLYATRALELTVPSHWRDWLGSLAWDELHDANLFLWTVAPTENPSVLDEENASLQTRVFMLYYGLMLAARRISTNGRGKVLTGARETEVDVRQHGWIDPLFPNEGSFQAAVARIELQEAAVLGNAITEIQNDTSFRRLRVALRCFHNGLREHDPPERIHQFVRAIEGCILPQPGRTKSQFASRTALFVGPHEQEWARALFDVRSAVEHLNDQLESVAMSVREEAIRRVLRFAFEAQALARYCLHRIFADATLREHFRDEESLGRFWSLEERERRALWGSPLDLALVRSEFDAEFFNSE